MKFNAMRFPENWLLFDETSGSCGVWTFLWLFFFG